MDFCPECKVKQQDLSEKQLYGCPECERNFCANHLDPKLVFYSASFNTYLIKDKKYRELVENDIRRHDAHPCVPYTQRRIKELEYEDRKLADMLKRFLDEKGKIGKEYQAIPTDTSVAGRQKYMQRGAKLFTLSHFTMPKWIGKGLLGIGISLLLVSFVPDTIFLILAVCFLAFLLHAWRSGSILLKSVAIVLFFLAVFVMWETFGGPSSLFGFMLAGTIFTEFVKKLDLFMNFLLSVPLLHRVVLGIVCCFLGLAVLKTRTRKKILSTGNLALISLLLLIIGSAIFAMMMDYTPPTITIISPETKTYDVSAIDLIYTTNEPISWACYSLDNAKNITLTGNTTLSNLSPRRYDLSIYANDTAGNIGERRVSFAVTRIFSSVDQLIVFLREDDLSDVEWTVNYTCDAFAKDFIKIAEGKGYYIFTYYALREDERDKYADALETICVIKTYAWGAETRRYDVSEEWREDLRVLGHAVVKTTVNGMDVIVDPQTDIILAMMGKGENVSFTVLYEGEITQE